LMGMRSSINRPKDRIQRINEIKRMKSSVARNLENASLDKAEDEIGDIQERLNRVNKRLTN